MAKNPILALLILVLAKGPHCLPFQADGRDLHDPLLALRLPLNFTMSVRVDPLKSH